MVANQTESPNVVTLELAERIRTLVSKSIPAKSTVILMESGIGESLDLPEMEVGPFALNGDEWDSTSPLRDSTEALAHLEVLVGKGAQFLIIPRPSFGWLSENSEFRDYLQSQYLTVRRDQDCIIYQLSTGHVYCPCCGRSYTGFLPFGVRPRPNAQCPGCQSLERHRLISLYLRDRTNFFTEQLRVLHFAPEMCFLNTFKSLPNLHYITTDLDSPVVMVRMDITDNLFRDNCFDVILCSHVLEHIPDDRKAMSELFRVLRPGGWAILQVPLWRETTYEDPSIVTPEDREKHFRQKDHVRMYGRDYKDRLESVGFNVKVDRYVRELGADLIKQYGLTRSEDVYFCTKP